MMQNLGRCLLIACVSVFTTAFAAHAELPTPDEIAANLGFPQSARQKVLNGEFVSETLKSSNERELAVAIVFFVSATVEQLQAEADKHLLTTTDPNTIEWAPISAEGSLDDFKTLNLNPDAETRANAYLNAKPGEDLNLDKAEISAFNAIQVPSGTSPVGPVTEAVKKQLLARYQAYHQKGLAGIAAYAREGGKTTPAAGDLTSATESLSQLKTAIPGLYDVLMNYPNDKPQQGFEESFMWSNYKAHGEPVFILTHTLREADQGAFVVVQRQFYVSGSYNVGQSIIALLPVKGGSIAIYGNRTSTDQVTGFGSSSKRAIGSKVMAGQLEDLYTAVRKKAEQDAK